MTVGERIRESRKAKGLTQKQLADKMHISYVNISQLECNERQPNRETIQRIADALEVNAAVLCYGTHTSTVFDSDNVSYSGRYMTTEEMDEDDDIFDYRDLDGGKIVRTSWREHVIKTLQEFPDYERKLVFDFIEFQRQQIKKRESGKGNKRKP